MAKLLLVAMLTGALASALTARSEPPLLIDSTSPAVPLDAQG